MKVKYLGTLAMASALGLSLAATGCSGGADPCAGNPCAGAEKTEEPCAGNPCAADPCAADPCAGS